MVYLKIKDIKAFMNALLIQETFDGFCCGRIQVISDKGVLTIESKGAGEAAAYGKIRPALFEFIKGRQLPEKISIQLLAEGQMLREVFGEDGELGSASLIISYRESELTMSSGVSLRAFSTDKIYERKWDETVSVFAEKLDIPFDVMI